MNPHPNVSEFIDSADDFLKLNHTNSNGYIKKLESFVKQCKAYQKKFGHHLNRNSPSQQFMFLCDFFDKFPYGIFQVNKKGQILTCNQKFLDILGVQNINQLSEKKVNFFDFIKKSHLKSAKNTTSWQKTIVNFKNYQHQSINGCLFIRAAENQNSFEGFIEPFTNRHIADVPYNQLEEALKYNQACLIIWKDKQKSKVKFVSENIKDIGYFPNQFYSGELSYHEIIYPDDIEKYKRYNKQFAQKNNDQHCFQYRINTRDGKVKWMREYSWKFKDEASGKVYIQGIITDQTREKNTINSLKDRERKYRLLTENLTDVVWMIDLNLNSLYISPSIKYFQGYTPKEYRQLPLEKKYTPDSLQIIKKELNKILNQMAEEKEINIDETYKLTLQYPCKDGSLKWGEITASPVFDNEDDNLIALQGVTRDVSQRIEIEKSLKESKKKLHETNTTKDKFFSLITHDLKNPFSSLLSTTELLLNHSDIIPEERKKTLLQLISRSAKHGYDILNNLQQWSQLQTGKIKYTPKKVSAKDIIETSLLNLKNYADKKSITIKTLVPKKFFLKADTGMLRTIFDNIINNAIKFSYPESTVKISAEQFYDQQNQAAYLEVCIKDNGVGIEAEKIPQLFQLDCKCKTPGTENEDGSGLGLILCNEMIRQNKGRIVVKSKPKKGSEFIVILPLID